MEERSLEKLLSEMQSLSSSDQQTKDAWVVGLSSNERRSLMAYLGTLATQFEEEVTKLVKLMPDMQKYFESVAQSFTQLTETLSDGH